MAKPPPLMKQFSIFGTILKFQTFWEEWEEIAPLVSPPSPLLVTLLDQIIVKQNTTKVINFDMV